jgi:predicted SAM-dependent methyltransferase
MIPQPVKDLYHASFCKLSALPCIWHRLRKPARFRNAFLNIGCGSNYVAGMINIDSNIFRKTDLWLDVTLGLPFPGGSLQGIYSSHMIEHLKLAKIKRLFLECHRVLAPGGRLRLVVPSLERAIEAYSRQDAGEFPDWPEKFSSLGGRFYNVMLCANQHHTLLDFSFLAELLSEAGFSDISKEAALTSRYFKSEHMSFESDPALIRCSLYVEAVKA